MKVSEGESEQQSASSFVTNSPGSTATRQRQQHEAGGKLIRSILSSNEIGQNQSSVAVQAKQKTKTMSLDNVKRPLGPTNSQLGLNSHVSNDIAALECDVDTKSVSDDKPDHGVWDPLHFSDVPKASEEHLTPFVLQSAQASRNPGKGINASAQEYVLTQGEMKSSIPSGSSGHNIPLENGSLLLVSLVHLLKVLSHPMSECRIVIRFYTSQDNDSFSNIGLSGVGLMVTMAKATSWNRN
ncbi:hypothetical protein J1N35_029615 [Gossypium stocksii]|uniref:Uncharacterized protein n=1 Tax=Gossypium stocksii TaxID=47602 RepID=A0A9D3ZT85_9ROSI|nr:hypothetical protein J1N35_029615 [Gossypium stocksii]